MLASERKILTWHPSGKSGVYMARKDYDRISNFILTVLKRNELTINDLLDLAGIQLAQHITNVSWYILTVKLDLEARGLIGTVSKPAPYNSQFLRLKPGALKKYRAYFIDPAAKRAS